MQDTHDSEHALSMARQAAHDGDYTQARHYTNTARSLGADVGAVAEMFAVIDDAEHFARIHTDKTVLTAIGIAVVGYAILSTTTPARLTPIAWFALAFGIVPSIVGTVSGHSHRASAPSKARFWRAWGIVAIAMALFAGSNLVILRGAIARPPEAGSLTTVVAAVAIAYGTAAGIVGGFCAAHFGHIGRHQA